MNLNFTSSIGAIFAAFYAPFVGLWAHHNLKFTKSLNGKSTPTCSNPSVESNLLSICSPFEKESTNLASQLSRVFPSFLNGKTLFLALLFFVSFTSEVRADHFRYGSISWKKTGPLTVEYKFTLAVATIVVGTPLPTTIGTTFDVPYTSFSFGDGSSISPVSMTITSRNLAEGWIFCEKTITYTYGSVGAYTAGMSTCCRIAGLANASETAFNLSTDVNLASSNASPISSFSPVICVPAGVATNSFYLSAFDPDGDPLTYSLNASTGGISSYPSGLSVASNGLVTFNTVGLSSGSQYAVQILVSDGKTSIPVDFIINIAAVSSAPPVFDAPTPASGSTVTASVGVPLAITLQATDPDGAADVVSLSVVGQPSGGTFSTALPASGNPSMTTLNWTPSASDAGSSFLVNVVASSRTCESAIISFTINVPNCPTVSITGLNAAYCKSASAVTLAGSPAGGSFTIDGNSATQLVPSALSVGNHTVVYTNGCGNTASQTVTINALPMVAITGLNAAYCKSASAVTLTGSPAGGSFTIDGNSATQLAPSVLSVGNHTVVYTYTDANTCSNTASQTVAINALPIVSPPTAGAISLQGGSTTLSVTASGGTPPYQYSLNNGTYQNSNTFIVKTGLYQVTVKDMSGCSVTSAALFVSDGPAPITCPAAIRIEFNQLIACQALPSVTGNLTSSIFANNITYRDKIYDVTCGVINPPVGNLFNATLAANTSRILVRTFSANNGGIISYECSQNIYIGTPRLSEITVPSNQNLPCANSSTDPSVTGWPTVCSSLLGQGLANNLSASYTDQRINTATGFIIQRTWTLKNICTGETSTFVQTLTYNSTLGTCPLTTFSVSGAIRREDAVAVPVNIVAFNSNNDSIANATGTTFTINNLLINNRFRITPNRPNTDWQNGVTSFDLALMSRHVLGIAPLTSPYQLIAADVNRNGEVDGTDILMVQRLILHLNSNFPNNNSWRFVVKNYQFQDPTNPFASDFPETLIVPNLTSAITNGDFVAIKVGDINQSLGTVSIRGGQNPYSLFVEDKMLEKGVTYEIPVRLNATASALQYALTIDKNAARLENIAKGDLPNCTDNNFGLFKNDNTLTAAWTRSPNQRFDENETFTMVNLTIKPTETVRLSQILSINPVYTEGVAYNEMGEGAPVKLSFGSKISNADKLTLLPNRPNPFSEATTISFLMPETSVAKVTVCDVLGKVLMTTEKVFSKGLNEMVFDAKTSVASGILVVRLQTDKGMAEQKIVLNH